MNLGALTPLLMRFLQNGQAILPTPAAGSDGQRPAPEPTAPPPSAVMDGAVQPSTAQPSITVTLGETKGSGDRKNV